MGVDFDLNMAKITKLLLLLLSSVSPVVLAVQPIVIVPGLGGSVLEANINNRTAYRDCHTDSEWFTIWVAQSQIAFRFACFLDGIVLEVDSGSSISNASGIEIRPRDFGGVDGVEYSNAGSGDVLPMPYMHEMIVALEAVGYKRGVSLRAATYDFRVAGLPEVLQWQYSQLKWLIEDTAAANDGQRVHLLSHSLGGPYANLFLTSFVSAPWKAKYIESHMMFSPPMAGTPVALEALIIGPQYDFVPAFLPAIVVPALRTFPSMLWMSPLSSIQGAASVFKDQVLVQTPEANYTSADLGQLFAAMNSTVMQAALPGLQMATNMTADAPGVKIFCAFVNDTKTTTSFALNSEFTKLEKTLTQTWGDGTVPLASLEVCLSWANKSSVYQFGGSLAAHTEILTYDQAIADIISWVQE